jgi:hypothetical protein
MPRPLAGGFDVQFRTPYSSRESPAPSVWGPRHVLDILLLMPGVFLSLLAQGVYPLLDKGPVMGCMLGLILLPVGLQVLGLVVKRPSADSAFWSMLFRGASAALLVLSLLLFLNGGLDRSPWKQVQTTVLRKVSYQDRHASRCALIVSSWRPGRSQEDLTVTSSVVDRALVGRTVTVQLRQGFFGLAWYGAVSPE